jgi:hypothetical protein
MKNGLRFRGSDSILTIVIRLWSGRPRSDGSIPCGNKELSAPKVVTLAVEST